MKQFLQRSPARSDLYRIAILAGLSAGLFGTGTTMAQDAAPAADDAESEQVITGTRLTAAEAEGQQSITRVDMNRLENQGFGNAIEVLQRKIPQLGGAGLINDGFGNGGNGTATISLRGLPAENTLTLVNGRRVSTSDIYLIPESALEDIEILNDGASSIYGSDAVAGVANFKLRKSFVGFKLDAYYNNTFDKDAGTRKFLGLWGASTEKTDIVFGGEHFTQNGMLSPDRDRSAPRGNQISLTSNPGTYTPKLTFGTHPVGDNQVADGLPLRWSLVPGKTLGLTSANQIPAGFDPFASVDTTSAQSAQAALTMRNEKEASLNSALPADSPVRYGPSPALIPGGLAGFPFAYYTTARRPREAYGGYNSVTHKIFGEQLVVWADTYYMRNQSEYQLAPSPLAGRTLPANNYYLNSIFFPGGGTAPGDMTFSYRPVELGPRRVLEDWNSFHNTTGLKGRFADSSWRWQVTHLYDRVDRDQTQTGGVKASEYERLLGLSTPDAFNPFGYTPIATGVSTVNSPEKLALFGASATRQVEYQTQAVDANVAGEIFDLRAGPLSAVFGGEYRREKIDDQPDFALRNELVFPFNIQQDLVAQRSITAGFAEIYVPVFGKDWNYAGIRKFDVTGAFRHEDFSDVGGTGIKPRVSFRWEPLDDGQLTIRGSWAQGFTAPLFADLYSKPGQDFSELRNPLTGSIVQPEDAVLTIGNRNLKPSESETWVIGGVYAPKYVKGLALGLQYYRISQDGVPFQSAQYIVNEWFKAGPSNPNNPYDKNALPSAQNPLGAQVELKPDGELLQVRNVGPINTGRRTTDGLDFNVEQTLDVGAGKLILTGRATHMLSWKQEDFPGAGQISYIGKYWANGAAHEDTSFPRWRAVLGAEYQLDRWSAAAAWNFNSGFKEDRSSQNFVTSDPTASPLDIQSVRSYQTVDLRLRYRLPRVEADIMFGINNVLDERPAFVDSSFENGYDRALQDIRGRMWFVSLSKKF